MNKKSFMLLALVITGLAIILLTTSKEKSSDSKAAAGLKAPELNLTDLDGKTWKLSDLRGKVVFINFWATWCSSCKPEKEMVQELVTAEKDNPDFVFLTVLYNDSPDRARDFMKQHNYTFPVLVDNASVSGSYGITGVPETFIIDPSGILRDKIIGPYRWNTSEPRLAIARLLKG
ncbi:MAG: TlpA disulfide reductase family protein [Dissulfurispiraceae bacterium]|jgi:peroxiredoxin|nr:TlpA disulfide reductase family protein [Dissulfurispiraceae bacterium]